MQDEGSNYKSAKTSLTGTQHPALEQKGLVQADFSSSQYIETYILYLNIYSYMFVHKIIHEIHAPPKFGFRKNIKYKEKLTSTDSQPFRFLNDQFILFFK